MVFLFINTSAHAGYFIFHSGENITGRRICGKVCSDNPNALRVDEQTYNAMDILTQKVIGGVVINKTQVELDTDAQARTDAEIQAVQNALDKFNISQLELITALIKRINVRIPSNPITKKEIIRQIKDDRP